MVPKHKSPTKADRTAVAPYNFVSIPDRVLAYIDSEEHPRNVDHSLYHGNRLTGWIDVTLETRSPIYIRGPLTPEEYEKMEEEEQAGNTSNLQKKRNKPDFFHTGDPNAPVIPGSSLRGMLRTLAQILSYGKLSPVSDVPLVYRAVADMSSHGDAYRARLMYEEIGQKNHYTPRFRGGYMQRDQGDKWSIQPAKEIGGTTYGRISRRDIPRNLKKWHNCHNASQVYIEIGPYQFQKVRGGFIHIKYARVLRMMRDETPGLKLAVLAESGKMFRKNSEAVIFAPDENAEPIPIPEKLVQAYRDQVSPEQERLLGKNGVLRHDQPVFYLIKDDALVFFGHTQMFRMPYLNSPSDMLPPSHGDDSLTDYAESIYGSAKGQEKGQAGRISISDARMLAGQVDPWLPGNPVVIPEILSGPKPTTFQHYLTQSRPDVPKGQGLYTYNDKPEQTTLRGFKMYWHKGDVKRGQFEEKGEVDPKKDTQHTRIKPVRSGVKFQFRVRFENLLLDELGLLWWTLALPVEGDYLHKIGMAKPLGLGAIKLSPEVVLTNPAGRYRSLFSQEGDSWEEAIVPAEEYLKLAVAKFEERVLSFNQQPKEKPFAKLDRVQELLDMLSWPGPQPPEELSRYMEIEHPDPSAKRGKSNEYRERPVLPAPEPVLASSRKVEHSPVKKQAQAIPSGYQTGKVKFFSSKGFGFIIPDDGGEDVYVNQKELAGGLRTLQEDQRVTFRSEVGPKGPRAVDVQLVG